MEETEKGYSAAIAAFSDVNIHKTEKLLLEAFDCVTKKVKDTQEYYDEFEIFYESVRKERIVEADLCLKFRIELKKRLFSDNVDIATPHVDTSKEPTKKQKKALDELAKLLSEPNVVVQWAIEQAASKAQYSKDNDWKLYARVKKGELKHKQLTVIVGSKKEFN
ncbi:MAG: hypothetical protein R2822_08830 [Spirosomataceae bacterium]